MIVSFCIFEIGWILKASTGTTLNNINRKKTECSWFGRILVKMNANSFKCVFFYNHYFLVCVCVCARQFCCQCSFPHRHRHHHREMVDQMAIMLHMLNCIFYTQDVGKRLKKISRQKQKHKKENVMVTHIND